MVRAADSVSYTDILQRAIKPDRGDWPVEVASGIMSIALAKSDVNRMNALAALARDGKLTAAEEDEMETYRQVCLFLDLMSAKARTSLARAASRA